MSQPQNLREQLESMIMLRRLALAALAVIGVLMVLTSSFGVAKEEIEQLDLIGLGVVPLALALIFGFGAFFYGLFGAAAQREREEKQLLALRRDTSVLEAGEDAVFGAERTFGNYRRFAPYVLLGIAVVIGGILLGAFWYYWNVSRPEALYIENYVKQEPNFVRTAVLAAVLMIASVLVGAFFIGQARTKEYRWLRPVGAYLVFNFVMMLGALLVALCGNFGVFSGIGTLLLKTFFALNGLLLIELLINLIVEFYRPRTREEEYPVFESKLLGLFTEPGGVMRNIAELLDYQFGFKVSGTYVYSFIERSLFPLLLLWALLLWASTSMTLVEPGSVGIRESFGKMVDGRLLEPGIYLSKPWPFGKISVYSYLKLHQISIGNVPHEDEGDEPLDDGHDHGDKPEKVQKPKGPEYNIRWENAHDHGGVYFLVNSSSPEDKLQVADGTARAAQSLDMVCFYIPIQYRIRKDGIFDYAYGHLSPEETLSRLSEEAATRLLFGMDMRAIMSHGRGDLEHKLKNEVQRLSDVQKLGIEIVSVNLTEVHPPMTDGAALAFYQVRIANETARTDVVRAEGYRDRMLPAAALAAEELTQQADSYKYNTVKVAEAEAGRFKAQLATSRILPQLFKLREYLYFWENDCANIRKYVVSKDFKDEVYTFNFEERNVYDILDSQLDSIGENK